MMALASGGRHPGSRVGFLIFVAICVFSAQLLCGVVGSTNEKEDCKCKGDELAQSPHVEQESSDTQQDPPEAAEAFNPPPARVNAEIGLGFRTYYLVHEVVSALKNKAQSLLSKPFLREYRKRRHGGVYSVASHWFRAVIAMLTGEVPLKEHPGSLVRTQVNSSKFRELEDEFVAVVVTAWGLVGPSGRDLTCDPGTATCRSQLEDVLYTALTLFWTEIMSPQPPGTMHSNFREIVSLSECPFSVLTDRDFIVAHPSGEGQSIAGVARRLQKLQEKHYTSSRCLLFKEHLLREMDRVGVTLSAQVSRMKNEIAGKSNYSFKDYLEAMEAKTVEEETAHKAKLLDHMRLVGDSVGGDSTECTQPCSALAADIAKAKEIVGPLDLGDFLASQLAERRENGRLCCTTKELMRAERKKRQQAKGNTGSGCDCAK